MNNDYQKLMYKAKQILGLVSEENKFAYEYFNRMATRGSINMFLRSKKYLEKFSKMLSPKAHFYIHCILGEFMPECENVDDTYALMDQDAIKMRAESMKAQLVYYELVAKQALKDSSIPIGESKPQTVLSLVA